MTSFLPRRSISWLSAHVEKLCLCVFVLFGAVATSATKLLPDEQNNVDVYQRCNPAVVNITAVSLRPESFFGVVPQKGVGSGAVIREEGYIVTNDHVVEGAQQVEVTLYNKTQYAAKLVGHDPDTDLAVLKIDSKGKKLAAIPLAGNEALRVGQRVLAIGNPFGLGGSLSVGIISSLGRDIQTQTNRTIKDVIQTDAAINPGNSGGPLLNSSGQLIGVNTQIVSRSGGSEGIGFAISVGTVQKITSQLIQFGRVLRPWLGARGIELPGSILHSLGVPASYGVMVTDVYRGSPAAEAGLRAHTREVSVGLWVIPYDGDVITRIDSTPVHSYGDLLDAIFEKKAGDVVTLEFFRGKNKRTVKMKLALPPDSTAGSL